MKKFICSVCGYVYEGEAAPEKCPQCKAPREKFVEQAEGEADEQKRAEYIAEAEQHLFTRWVLSPIYFSYGGYLQSENLEGVEVSALGYKFFGHANLI